MTWSQDDILKLRDSNSSLRVMLPDVESYPFTFLLLSFRRPVFRSFRGVETDEYLSILITDESKIAVNTVNRISCEMGGSCDDFECQ